MRATLITALVLPLAVAGCAVERGAETRPTAWSSASPYAAEAPRVISAVPGTYCAEAVSEAQDAAALASASGSARDAGRASRTANYAARDCR